MNTITVDARGLACPQPVVLAKNAQQANNTSEIIVLVDNDTARQNVLQMAAGKGLTAVATAAGDDWSIKITPQNDNGVIKNETDSDKTTVLLTSETIGAGSEELGKILMRGFLYALLQQDKKIEAIILMNGGIKLAVEGSDSIDELKGLEGKGTKLLICGTCLDYYHKKDEMLVGTVSNMYTITETLLETTRIITP